MNKWSALILLVALAMAYPLVAQSAGQPNTGGTPLSSQQEANEAGTMLLLSAIYGIIVRPVLNYAVNHIQAIPNDVSAAIMAGVTLLLYLVLWKTLGGTSPDSPTDWQHWALAALAALGAGSVASSVQPVARAVTNKP
jgi:hypothetical protein